MMSNGKIPVHSTPWARETEGLLEDLGTSREEGLSDNEAAKRRREYGPNSLRSIKTRSLWQIAFEQFRSLIIGLLAAAAVLSFAFGELVEAFAVLAVILINAAIGFATELRATRSMEALQRLGAVQAKVVRGGSIREVGAEELVPGDIVVLEGGDVVTADMRIVEASRLQSDESALTGESLPVGKTAEALDRKTRLPDRRNMLFKGTAVTRGSGRGLVVSTGMATEIGRISSLVEEAGEERTPLEKRLDRLGNRLIWVTLAVALLTAASGILAGKQVILMVETSLALAVAAIPEGLPIVATIALARGMWRMARRNVLINRLSAVETLGATTVICTDKTGTLTENRMTVTRIDYAGTGDVAGGDGEAVEVTVSRSGDSEQSRFALDGRPIDPAQEEVLRRVLTAGILCNNASLGDEGAVGDAMEVALLRAGRLAGMERRELVGGLPEEREEAFDSSVKMMATFHRTAEGSTYVAVKGAPEAVLEGCTETIGRSGPRPMDGEERDRWMRRNERMAESGLRVLAVAERTVDSTDARPYREMRFLGLVGLMDPPRTDVRRSIELCRKGGIRIIMVTGDQPKTALSVALSVGLADEDGTAVMGGAELKDPESMGEEERSRVLGVSIFSRVSPEQKLDIIGTHQANGDIVAMTGDGVNDAPALKKADIGVAMGRRGTQVAQEASDMILKDDAFASIVAAVEQGRIIFDNIRRFVIYLLSCNVSEIMTVSLATLAGGPLPILPLQILFLNLVTDVFPALALGVGPGDRNVMERPPRDPEEPVLTGAHWWGIAGYSGLITAAVLGALAVAILVLHMDQETAVTVSFLTLAGSQLWHVFNMRAPGSPFLANGITKNRYVWGALALCVLLLLAAVYIPGLSEVLRLNDPGLAGWLLAVGMSLVPWLVGQILLSVRRPPVRRPSDNECP